MLACGCLGACGGGSTGPGSSVGVLGGPTKSAGGGRVSALSAESQSLATGDIPDNQVFLTFNDHQAGYSMRYPEGWALRGSGWDVTFQEKNNAIHVVIGHGPAPSTASVIADLERERASQPSLSYGHPSTVSIAGTPALRVSYSTLSQPNPVTGKRVRLLVDRYVLAHAGRTATIDLGTPAGVDNVDAYRMISRSFRWR